MTINEKMIFSFIFLFKSTYIIMNENMFKLLRDFDEIEEDDDTRHYIENVNNDKITDKDVDMLYTYFVDEGLSNKKQIRCLPQNWRISREHIYASLRRNNGDVHKAGKDLSELIQNTDFNIKTFYAKLPYSELVASENNIIYSKPYLSGQEWQIKPEKGIYLVYNDKVYKINYVSLEYGFFTLDKVITNDFNSKVVKFVNEDVRYGKYKQIKENLQEYLEKEYKILCNELEKVYKDGDMWLKKQFEKREVFVDTIENIQRYHNDTCTFNAKIKLVGRFDLPISAINNIVSFNIESICNCNWKIQDFQDSIDHIDYIIDEGYLPYNNLLWKKEVAYHVLCGDYEEWINDY